MKVLRILLLAFLLLKEGSSVEYIIEYRTHRLTIPVVFHPTSRKHAAVKGMENPSGNLTITSDETPTMQSGRSMIRGKGMGSNNHTVNQADKNATEQDVPGMSPRLSAQVSVAGKYVSEPSDTDAEYGDPCEPNDALEWDYCERAPYPNKGRMVCATPDMDAVNAFKCICKFAKIEDRKWKQLRYDETKKLCLSPSGGRCYVKFPDKEKSLEMGAMVYVKDIVKAHEQCDDLEPLDSKNRTLLCSQAHPRRFSRFNAYHYYCLKSADRSGVNCGLSVAKYVLITSIVIQFTF